MVKKSKKAKAAASDDGGEQVKASEVQKMISGPALKKLMSAKRSATQDVAEINGSLGSEIKEAVKNKRVHKKALAMIFALDRLEPEALSNLMDHFEYYYDVSGLKKRADSVQRLPMEEGDDDGEGEESNVTQFPAAAE